MNDNTKIKEVVNNEEENILIDVSTDKYENDLKEYEEKLGY